MSFFADVLEKLARPPEEIRAENLRRWASEIPGRTPIEDLEARSRQKVGGVVQNIRIDPRAGRGSIEATIIDGTGSLSVKWLGRQELAGIRLGVGLVIEGTIGTGDDGDFTVLNPEYDLIPAPEHG